MEGGKYSSSLAAMRKAVMATSCSLMFGTWCFVSVESTSRTVWYMVSWLTLKKWVSSSSQSISILREEVRPFWLPTIAEPGKTNSRSFDLKISTS